MGDRANIVMKQNISDDQLGTEIFFYTHWSGHELPQILQDALKRGEGRWNDESYLGRIIFCEMIKGEVLEETGYGISTYETDNDGYPHLIVDSETTTITLRGGDVSHGEGLTISFADFIALQLDEDAPDDDSIGGAWGALGRLRAKAV